MNKVYLVIVFVIVINYGLSYIQIREIKNTIASIKKRNLDRYVSVGKDRKILKKGSIAIVVADKTGIIREVYLMKGRSILAKFNRVDGFDGLMANEAIEITDENSLIEALEYIINEKNRGY